MDLGIILTMAGIGATIVFGVLGFRHVRKKQMSQKQKVGSDSVAIQSGRDTNIEKRDG